MFVSKHLFSNIFWAFRMIDEDNDPEPACPDHYTTPDRYDLDLPRFDMQLGKLSADEFRDLCMGEETEMMTVVNTHGLQELHSFLNNYFEEWADE